MRYPRVAGLPFGDVHYPVCITDLGSEVFTPYDAVQSSMKVLLTADLPSAVGRAFALFRLGEEIVRAFLCSEHGFLRFVQHGEGALSMWSDVSKPCFSCFEQGKSCLIALKLNKKTEFMHGLAVQKRQNQNGIISAEA